VLWYPTQAQNQGLTPISCHAAPERSACAPFIKERRMECINATNLHRKSGQWGTQPLLPAKSLGECIGYVDATGGLLAGLPSTGGDHDVLFAVDHVGCGGRQTGKG
jgi:hypothetical protein